MGSVIDEETGEEPSCIYCGSRGDCPHLVAVIDRTFAECNGGALYESIGRLRKIVSDCVAIAMQDDAAAKEIMDSELLSIIQGATDNHDSEYPEDVYIDERMFLSWLIDSLLDAGADELPGSIVEEGGPGQSSSLNLLYSPEPEVLIRSVEEPLQRLFRVMERSAADKEAESFEHEPSDQTSDPETNAMLNPFVEKTPRAKTAAPKRTRVTRRPVLIVVTDWPDGTMAFKFGGAMQASLDSSESDMQLLQMTPERIFRVETTVSETEFRETMEFKDVASGGRILFIEIPKD